MNKYNLQQDLNLTIQGLKNANKWVSSSPKGTLQKVQRGNCSYFEQREYEGKRRKVSYVSAGDIELILKFAKSAYAKALIPILSNNEKAIRCFLDLYTSDPASAALAKLPDWVAEYIQDKAMLTNSAAIKQWLAEPYNQNPYKPEQRNIATLRGDCVRSKAERDIADALFRHSIPYRTDCELPTSQGSIYADFVILHPKTLELYYWEHSGMLDAANYVGKNFDRLARYAAEGILVGERLILTGETSRCSLSTATIEKIIEAYFG